MHVDLQGCEHEVSLGYVGLARSSGTNSTAACNVDLASQDGEVNASNETSKSSLIVTMPDRLG